MSPPIRVLRPVIFLACLVPFALLLRRGFAGTLGANPLSEITNQTGVWTLRFLMITLAITPVRRVASQPWLIRFRRMCGLFAFFYGTLHFLTYIWFDQFFALAAILKDVQKRPFITAGFTGFVLMVPLALTSTDGMIRRMGGRNWQRLHRLIYVTALAGVVHYWWLVKADILRPQIYASILTVLLGFRVYRVLSTRWGTKPLPRAAQATK